MYVVCYVGVIINYILLGIKLNGKFTLNFENDKSFIKGWLSHDVILITTPRLPSQWKNFLRVKLKLLKQNYTHIKKTLIVLI